MNQVVQCIMLCHFHIFDFVTLFPVFLMAFLSFCNSNLSKTCMWFLVWISNIYSNTVEGRYLVWLFSVTLTGWIRKFVGYTSPASCKLTTLKFESNTITFSFLNIFLLSAGLSSTRKTLPWYPPVWRERYINVFINTIIQAMQSVCVDLMYMIKVDEWRE